LLDLLHLLFEMIDWNEFDLVVEEGLVLLHCEIGILRVDSW